MLYNLGGDVEQMGGEGVEGSNIQAFFENFKEWGGNWQKKGFRSVQAFWCRTVPEIIQVE